MPPISHYLRTWDAISATRVHHFAANSKTVARRLHTYYRRDATVIYPPVDTGDFQPVPPSEVEDFYLMVGELVAYKRPELAVQAFNKSGRKLVIVGGGEMLLKIKAMAKPNITVLGPQPFNTLRDLYARARALVFPGEEDFGIVPVEAMASGRPVIAFGKGGATETVVDGLSGRFFASQTVESLLEALEKSEATAYDPVAIVAHAQTFGADRFATAMRRFVDESLVAFHA